MLKIFLGLFYIIIKHMINPSILIKHIHCQFIDHERRKNIFRHYLSIFSVYIRFFNVNYITIFIFKKHLS